MRKPELLASVFLLLGASVLVSCGSSRQIQSITITPASADAANYPNRQVQYTATANYSDGTQVKSVTALWTPGPPWALTPQIAWPAIQLSQSGLASCGMAGAGTYTIYATVPVDPGVPVPQLTMTTAQKTGTAQLICP